MDFIVTCRGTWARGQSKKSLLTIGNRFGSEQPHSRHSSEPLSFSPIPKEALRKGNQWTQASMSERCDCCGSDQQSHEGMTGSMGAVNGSTNAATADKSNCLWLERKVIVSDRRHAQDAAENWGLTIAGVEGLQVQDRNPGESDWKES